MSFDSSVPTSLLDLQKWVSGMLVRLLRQSDAFNIPLYDSETGAEIEKWITPGPRLTASQRIGIYNQQYWFRLLTLMQEDYPTLVRLFGYADFNRIIAQPYLLKYTPNHSCLASLGTRLLQWIEEDYREEDKHLVLSAARVDEAYERLFFALFSPPLDTSSLDCLADKPIYLQPFVALFDLGADLFTFRSEMLSQEPEYWLENDFPKIDWSKSHYFALHRKRGELIWEEMEPDEFSLLRSFEKGAKIEEALFSFDEENSSKLAEWFQKWAQNGWLTIEPTDRSTNEPVELR